MQVPARGRDMRMRKPPPWTFSSKISEELHSEIFGVKGLESEAGDVWLIDGGVEIDLTLELKLK